MKQKSLLARHDTIHIINVRSKSQRVASFFYRTTSKTREINETDNWKRAWRKVLQTPLTLRLVMRDAN